MDDQLGGAKVIQLGRPQLPAVTTQPAPPAPASAAPQRVSMFSSQGWGARPVTQSHSSTLPANPGEPGRVSVFTSTLKPAFSVDKQRALLDKIFGASADRIQENAAQQADRQALRSGMSVNGGQATREEAELSRGPMADLELARLQAQIGLDQAADDRAYRDRMYADQQAFQNRMYADQQAHYREEANRDASRYRDQQQQYDDSIDYRDKVYRDQQDAYQDQQQAPRTPYTSALNALQGPGGMDGVSGTGSIIGSPDPRTPGFGKSQLASHSAPVFQSSPTPVTVVGPGGVASGISSSGPLISGTWKPYMPATATQASDYNRDYGQTVQNAQQTGAAAKDLINSLRNW